MVELASEKEHNKSLMKEIQDIRKDRDQRLDELKKQAEFQRARISQGAAFLQKPTESEDDQDSLKSLNQSVKTLIENFLSKIRDQQQELSNHSITQSQLEAEI